MNVGCICFPHHTAVAASAAFPGLIGPLVLQPRNFDWHCYDDGGALVACPAPEFARLHLWDGGVYDNLGVEALFKPRSQGDRFRSDVDFLIVSDASAELPLTPAVLMQRPKRLITIATDQVRSLRARTLADQFSSSPNSGVYLRMGRPASYLLREAGGTEIDIARVREACLAEDDVRAAADLGTNLKQLPEPVFDRLYRHGWEVADCTLRGRCPDLFAHRLWHEPSVTECHTG